MSKITNVVNSARKLVPITVKDLNVGDFFLGSVSLDLYIVIKRDVNSIEAYDFKDHRVANFSNTNEMYKTEATISLTARYKEHKLDVCKDFNITSTVREEYDLAELGPGDFFLLGGNAYLLVQIEDENECLAYRIMTKELHCFSRARAVCTFDSNVSIK